MEEIHSKSDDSTTKQKTRTDANTSADPDKSSFPAGCSDTKQATEGGEGDRKEVGYSVVIKQEKWEYEVVIESLKKKTPASKVKK